VTAVADPGELRSRNATEEAILDAARAALASDPYEGVTIETIARRALVSRTTVYFYFPNKRAIVDRVIQQTFQQMYTAATRYVSGDGDPRLELRLALARLVTVVNANARVLLLAAQLSGARGEGLPAEWEPYLRRFWDGAEERIRRDQARGIAPDDVPARVSAQAMCAMVERHLTHDVLRGAASRESVRALAELWWRAVYGLGAAWAR
jgi:AcrR family transcriptional regulator